MYPVSATGAIIPDIIPSLVSSGVTLGNKSSAVYPAADKEDGPKRLLGILVSATDEIPAIPELTAGAASARAFAPDPTVSATSATLLALVTIGSNSATVDATSAAVDAASAVVDAVSAAALPPESQSPIALRVSANQLASTSPVWGLIVSDPPCAIAIF